jgi:hypothetical protein
MIRCTLIFTVGWALAFGQKQSGEIKSRDHGGAKKASAISIPAGSIEIAPGVYKYTDSAGKESIYRKTPFGVVKMNDNPDAERAPAERGNPFSEAKTDTTKSNVPTVTVIEEGEMVRFERSTPFGPSRWTRKKSELSEGEREMLARYRTAKSGNTGPKE